MLGQQLYKEDKRLSEQFYIESKYKSKLTDKFKKIMFKIG